MASDVATYYGTAVIPGPSSLPTGNGQVASYNLVGGLPVFAGWITPVAQDSSGRVGLGATASSSHRLTISQSSPAVSGMLLSGNGRAVGGGTSTAGVEQFLNVNVSGNRQLVVGPSDGWGNASVRFFRLAFVGATAALDAITGTGQRADMQFGTGTTNVAFGSDSPGPSTAKAFFGCESGKVGQVVRAAVSQSSNLHEWQASDGTVAAAIGPKGAIKPASLADADAPNGSIYYSTTASKLVYKDSSGVVNALY